MDAAHTQVQKFRNVLFVCEDNARHSLIAEVLLRDHGVRGLRAFSAGITPADRADSYALSALALAGLGSDGLWPKHWEGFRDAKRLLIDMVVMIGDGPARDLPRTFPGNPEYVVWKFEGDLSLRFHHGVWRDIQVLRPCVEALVDDLRYAVRPTVNNRQQVAAE
jgi:protein-tyrosine-phosphatase